jgi:hypothetical protein
MKKLIVVVAFIAAVCFAGISCNWFTASSADATKSFLGNWKIDSISMGDSTAKGIILLSAVTDDTASHDVRFTKDSVFINTKDSTVTGYRWLLNEKEKQITVVEKEEKLSYAFPTENNLRLQGIDSSMLFPKKP